jgi:hypothetical protein
MNKIKLILAFLILAGVVNCSRITEKVEQKVNEKIDQKIDETLNKLDSNMKNINLDSISKKLDSLKVDSDSSAVHPKIKRKNNF